MGGSAYLAGAGCLSAVLGLIFTLIGFASPYWISFETGTSGATGYVNNYRGIWQSCSQENDEDKKCDSMVDDDNPGWLEACQALATMGFLGTLMGTVLLICWSCTYRLSSVLKITIILTLLISFVFLAVTVIVYRAEVYDEMSIIGTFDYELDWSFYTMVVGCVFVAVAVACVIPASPSDYGQQKYPYGFPYGLGLQNIMNGGRGYYGDPGYGRVSRPVYGRTGAGVYGGSSPRGADGYYDREPYRRTMGGAYDPYSRGDRRY